MNTAAPVEKTRTVGYFNPHNHALHVVISRFNITLELPPGKFVEDTKGRKINDPFFDAYKLLSKETGETDVPLIRLAPPQPSAEQRYDGHAVRQVTEFTHDKRGVRQPVMPERGTIKSAPANQPSVVSMSVEEARRLGLINRTRSVPEDYGVTDTDGAPPSGIPPIKLATDLPARNSASTSTTSGVMRAAQAKAAVPAQAPALPPEPVDDGGDGLEPADLNIVDPLSAANVAAVMESATAAPVPAPSPAVVSAIPSAEDEPLPLPVLAQPLVDLGPDSVVPTTDGAPAASAAPAGKKFVCAADGKAFDSYGELSKHVRKSFRDLKTVRQLLKPYENQQQQ